MSRSLLPLDLTGQASITFNAYNRVVMRIDKDGRLHAGPELSKEEASRALFEVCRQTFDAEWTRRERKIEELKRENAALRAISIEAMISNTAFRMKELERENAALRSALTTLLAWEDKGGDIPPTAARGLFRIARAALDAARKEAQP